MWLTIDAKNGATIGRIIAMTNRTAVKKKVALVMINANVNRKIAATVMKPKVMKPKVMKTIRTLKLMLELAK